MLILWFRKNKSFKQNVEEKKETQSFAEHNATMKQFRMEHLDIAVSCPNDILTDDGNLLASVETVKLWPNIQN
jgi:hypothetical protein